MPLTRTSLRPLGVALELLRLVELPVRCWLRESRRMQLNQPSATMLMINIAIEAYLEAEAPRASQHASSWSVVTDRCAANEGAHGNLHRLLIVMSMEPTEGVGTLLIMPAVSLYTITPPHMRLRVAWRLHRAETPRNMSLLHVSLHLH
jgi:hypothetical protein